MTKTGKVVGWVVESTTPGPTLRVTDLQEAVRAERVGGLLSEASKGVRFVQVDSHALDLEASLDCAVWRAFLGLHSQGGQSGSAEDVL